MRDFFLSQANPSPQPILIAPEQGQDFFRELIQGLLLFIPRLGISILVLIVFWLAAISAKRIIRRFSRRSGLNLDVASLMAKLAYLSVLIFGLITALGTIGIDVKALVAGLGLTGFAVGLALKDILSNFISGILILIYKPFRRHDYISVSGFEGEVIEIDLRYTTLQGKEQRILIPNSNLFTNTISVINKSKEEEDKIELFISKY
ncbi:MAG: mechanosensitive ion channel family protein [Chroococcales cyanobacterium]